MIVTTSYDPSDTIIQKAKRLADELGVRVVPRRHMTIRRMQERYGIHDVLVVTDTGLSCYRNRLPPLFFHPGSSYLRVKRMLATGGSEPLLSIPDVRPGDTIVDCTAGLCSDAIAFSYAAGEQGKVIAIEADRIISLIAREGLQQVSTDLPEFDAAMRRIQVMHGQHLDVLRSMPDRSADIVYFDPMFRSPIEESSGISPLRNYAYMQPVTAESVAEAKRVARRTVMLKERRGSSQFAKLGFLPDERHNAKIAFGVIQIL
jgi:16S rRNA G966 N2-methylase RsmD